MIQQLLQHLDTLQVDLAAIDPCATDAADRVAAIAFALRRSAESDMRLRAQAPAPRPQTATRDAA